MRNDFIAMCERVRLATLDLWEDSPLVALRCEVLRKAPLVASLRSVWGAAKQQAEAKEEVPIGE